MTSASFNQHDPKETRNRFIVGLIIILFFAVAMKCSAQVTKVDRYSFDIHGNVTTYYPTQPIEVGFDSVNSRNNICFNIYSDSLWNTKKDIRSVYIVVQYRKNEVLPNILTSLQIEFDNGQIVALPAVTLYREDNSVEYQINKEALSLLAGRNMKRIIFETAETYITKREDHCVKFIKEVVGFKG